MTNCILPVTTNPNVKTAPHFGWDYNAKNLPIGYDEQDRFNKVTDIELLDPINDWHLSRMLYLNLYRSQALQYLGPLLDKINPIPQDNSLSSYYSKEDSKHLGDRLSYNRKINKKSLD